MLRFTAYAYIASLPLNGLLVGQFRSLPALISLLLIATWIVSPGKRARTNRDFAIKAIYGAAAAYVIVGALKSFSALDSSVSLQVTMTALGLLLTLPPLARVLSEGRRTPLAVLAYSSAVLAVAVMLGVGQDITFEGRATALSLNPNQAGRFVALGLFAALWCLVRARPWERIPLLMAAGACFAAVLLTGSRTNLTALVLASLALVAFGLTTRQQGTALLLSAVPVAAICWAAYGLVAESIPDRLGGTIEAFQVGNFNFREIIWRTLLDNSEAWLPWGIGTGNVPALTQDLIGLPAVAHQAFLESAVELGFIGIVIMGFFVVGLFIGAARSPYTMFAVPATVIIVVTFFSGSIFLYKEVWLVAAFCLARAPGAALARSDQARRRTLTPR